MYNTQVLFPYFTFHALPLDVVDKMTIMVIGLSLRVYNKDNLPPIRRIEKISYTTLPRSYASQQVVTNEGTDLAHQSSSPWT